MSTSSNFPWGLTLDTIFCFGLSVASLFFYNNQLFEMLRTVARSALAATVRRAAAPAVSTSSTLVLLYSSTFPSHTVRHGNKENRTLPLPSPSLPKKQFNRKRFDTLACIANHNFLSTTAHVQQCYHTITRLTIPMTHTLDSFIVIRSHNDPFSFSSI